ncbi:MAG: hypothetical protein BWK80_60465, partial [Desulfobacteraceae bacterium IS3]
MLRGGNVIVYVDPTAVSDSSPAPNGMPKPSSLDKLFKAWGIKIDSGKVLADFDYATRLRNQANQVEENPLWISVKNESFNSDNITTAKLEGMLFPVAGVIEKLPDSPFEY